MSAEPAVLVPQAESLGALAVIRSLGRAGYRIHAASTRGDALGFASRFAHHRVVSPRYDDPRYADWARAYVREHGIATIIPSEGFLLALGPARSELHGLFPFAPDERTLMGAMSKHELLTKLSEARAPHLPPTLLVDDLRALPSLSALEQLAAPLYVKLDGCHALDGSAGETRRFEAAAPAHRFLTEARRRFSRAVVQGHVPGQGVAAFFLRAGGTIRAELMQRRLHEVPWTGGVSSLRETFWHEAIARDARDKLALSGFEGVAMMEYRLDPKTGRFWFIEMNARFWGSLHLALHAGVDFPRLLVDASRGLPVEAPRARQGVRSRHLPLELQHVWSKLKARELPVRAKAAALFSLAAGTLDPRIKSDLAFPGDRAVFGAALRQFVAATLRRPSRHERLASGLRIAA